MTYNKNKPIIYGIIGIALALTILTFIPTTQETHITPSISLDQIPGYGIQTIKISEQTTQLTHLILNIASIQAQTPSGEWITITTQQQQWDIHQETQKTFTLNQDITDYTQLRLNITPEGSSATLQDGQPIQIGLPSFPIEIQLTPANENSGVLKLSLSQGTSSTQILPNMQLEVTTIKLTGEITPQ